MAAAWGKADSIRLARLLQAEIDAGRCQEYATKREATLAALPSEECRICGGTGKRKAPPEPGPGEHHCNGCDGSGRERPWECNYGFSVENVQDFVDFLKDCGGFEIW